MLKRKRNHCQTAHAFCGRVSSPILWATFEPPLCGKVITCSNFWGQIWFQKLGRITPAMDTKKETPASPINASKGAAKRPSHLTAFQLHWKVLSCWESTHPHCPTTSEPLHPSSVVFFLRCAHAHRGRHKRISWPFSLCALSVVQDASWRGTQPPISVLSLDPLNHPEISQHTLCCVNTSRA